MLRVALVSTAVAAVSGLQAGPVVRAPVLASAASSPRPLLLGSRAKAAAFRMAEFPTLEEELEAGRITQEEYDELSQDGGAMTEEEFVQQEEAPKELSAEAAKVVKGMTSATGVEFAPWMKVDAEAIAKAKKDRELRKAKQAAARNDAMLIDPQAAELSGGGGLSSKVLSEEEIELRWDTGDETGNVGFIVQRRPGGSEDWIDLASYEGFAPLRTKGPGGGSYVYLDDAAGVGTWVYRILDCDTGGQRSAVCQRLVEVDSEAEGKQTIVVGVLIAGLALAFVAAGVLIDPIQTTSAGRNIF